MQKLLLLLALILVLTGCSTIYTEANSSQPAQPVVIDNTPSPVTVTQSAIPLNPLKEATGETTGEELKVSQKELTCMADAMYYEARGEGAEGMHAVGYVVLNRMRSSKFPSTACGVVYQKAVVKGRKYCQFNWACRPLKRKDPTAYAKALEHARLVFRGEARNRVGNALFFHEKRIRHPSRRSITVAVIGNHRFYVYN